MQGIPVGDNIKGIFDAELERLEQYLGRLSDKPLRIYEELMRIVVRVDEKIEYNGLADGRVDDFRTKLDNSALDILTHDDQVKSAVRARAAARFDRMTGPEQEHYLFRWIIWQPTPNPDWQLKCAPMRRSPPILKLQRKSNTRPAIKPAVVACG